MEQLRKTLAEIRAMAAEGLLDAAEAQEMKRGVIEEARLERESRGEEARGAGLTPCATRPL